MARRHWRSGRPVKDVLAEEPYRFDPFQAARLLEALAPEADPLASSPDPRREAMRFVGAGGMGFPASAIAALQPARPADERHPALPPQLVVTFLDLIGQNGPLPHAYTEMVRDRVARGDRAMKAFLDMFVHRLVSVLIRAKRRHYPGLDNLPPDQGRMTGYLLAMLGLGTPGLAGRLAIPDRLLLRYAALFASRPRSAAGLVQILEDMIGAPVRLHALRGRWLPLAKGDHSRLADLRGFGGQNARLGHGVVLGTRVWAQDDGIRLDVGPLSLLAFRALLPGGAQHLRVASLIRFYLDRDLDVSLRLVLRRADLPGLRLSATPAPSGPRLGYSAWLSTRTPRSDDTQVVLTVPTVDEIAAALTRPQTVESFR
ncbi:type VI secretion system baseplate subunit TssG [Insolitispirillum peregrinum]|uniref:type VI secretion system baseplate subunit TssG n=1 Tax=Insolitispirillum peregrinum TaxID=80876 RepID=UPI003616A1C7